MGWSFWFVVIPCTVVPIVVAMKRKCYHDFLIYAIAFFFGWTVIGGIAAFLWALYGRTTPPDTPPQASPE